MSTIYIGSETHNWWSRRSKGCVVLLLSFSGRKRIVLAEGSFIFLHFWQFLSHVQQKSRVCLRLQLLFVYSSSNRLEWAGVCVYSEHTEILFRVIGNLAFYSILRLNPVEEMAPKRYEWAWSEARSSPFLELFKLSANRDQAFHRPLDE